MAMETNRIVIAPWLELSKTLPFEPIDFRTAIGE
jgi:hypothetical protein